MPQTTPITDTTLQTVGNNSYFRAKKSRTESAGIWGQRAAGLGGGHSGRGGTGGCFNGLGEAGETLLEAHRRPLAPGLALGRPA